MTELLYLLDTYKFNHSSVIIDKLETAEGTSLILEETVFYPQGGGQPSDIGRIYSNNGEVQITSVRLDPTSGRVKHIYSKNEGELNIGDVVTLEVDSRNRIYNSRNHSAGHLLDLAVYKSKIKGLKPFKGYHYKDGACVEYLGMFENKELIPQYTEEILNLLKDLIKDEITIIAKGLNSEEIQKYGVTAPDGKSPRFVYFDGYPESGCGCGGTHVKSSKDVGDITIRKIVSKGGVTKIGYDVC